MLVAEHRARARKCWTFSRKWGLDAVVIGEVKDGELAVVKNHGAVAAENSGASAGRGRAACIMRAIAAPATRVESEKDWFSFSAEERADGKFQEIAGLAGDCFEAMDHRAVRHDGADEYLWLDPARAMRQWVRIKESEKDGPNGKTMRALALSTDGNGRWCQLNPKRWARCMRLRRRRETLRRAEHVRCGNQLLNFGSPEKPEVMWQFSRAIDGIAEACNRARHADYWRQT